MPPLFLHVPHDVADHVVLEGEHLVDIPSAGKFVGLHSRIVAQELLNHLETNKQITLSMV